MKKYEFTGETKIINGITVHRIRFVRDIDFEYGSIKSGTIGGWIETESNLSNSDYDTGYVLDNAVVYGNARVENNGRVADNAIVYGNAKIYGCITNNATVCDNSIIYENAWVKDNAHVYGDAKINNVVVRNNEKVNFSVGIGF